MREKSTKETGSSVNWSSLCPPSTCTYGTTNSIKIRNVNSSSGWTDQLLLWCLTALRCIQVWWRYRMLSPINIDITLLLDTHTKCMPLLSLGIKSAAQYQTWTIIHIRMVEGIKVWVNVHPVSFPVGYWIPRLMLRSCDSWRVLSFFFLWQCQSPSHSTVSKPPRSQLSRLVLVTGNVCLSLRCNVPCQPSLSE